MDDELGRAGDTEEGLLRSCAETQGCTAPGRSTDVGRGDSLLVAVLLELLVLQLENTEVRRLKHFKLLLKLVSSPIIVSKIGCKDFSQ